MLSCSWWGLSHFLPRIVRCSSHFSYSDSAILLTNLCLANRCSKSLTYPNSREANPTFQLQNTYLPWLAAVEIIDFLSFLQTAWSAKKVSSWMAERTAKSQAKIDPPMEVKPNIKKSLWNGLAVAQGCRFKLKINKISPPGPNTQTKEIVWLSTAICLRNTILITKSSKFLDSSII